MDGGSFVAEVCRSSHPINRQRALECRSLLPHSKTSHASSTRMPSIPGVMLDLVEFNKVSNSKTL
jgi:hypothetical protein